MVWIGSFRNSTAEMFTGVEGYFSLNGAGSPGKIPTNLIATSSTQVIFGVDNNLGRISFFGTGLTTGFADLPNDDRFPVLTGGTLTGFEYSFNYLLWNAMENNVPIDPVLFLPQNLEPSASVQLPNIPAAALTNAIVQSYNQGNPAILRAFFSADSHVYTGSDGVNLMAGYDGNDLLIGLGGNDFLQGDGGNDTLDGGPGTDGLNGGEGSDLYLPGPPEPGNPVGDSVSDSGLTPGDIDTISYANATSAVVVDLNPLDGNQSAGWAAGLLAGGIERVVGSRFNDVLIGTDMPEAIQDTASDTLEGGAGDDTLYGLSGSDFLQGGPGFDVLIGGPDGDIRGPGPGDTAVFAAAAAQIDLFRANDGAFLVVAPGGGVDRLYEIEFIAAADGVFPILSRPLSNKGLQVGDGTPDSLTGTGGADLLFGRGGDDTLRGGGGQDLLEGDVGADVLDGGTGEDTMFGGEGGDTYVVDSAGDVVVETGEDGGFDRILSSISYMLGQTPIEGLILTGSAETGVGNALDNLLTGNAGDNRLESRGGADTVEGGDGRDLAFLGAGNDLFLDNGQGGAAGRDTVWGEDGADTIQGGGGNDLFGGGTGADLILGRQGDDMVYGGDQNDTVFGGAGADTVDGGNGQDEVWLEDGDDLFLDNGQGGAFGRDTVFAGAGDDTIQGGNGGDQFFGGSGNDLILGRLGDDRIFGNEQDDTIYAGAGNDTVNGGKGRDTAFLEDGDDLYEDVPQGDPYGADRAFGGSGNDTLAGNGGSDTLVGEGGHDLLFGGDQDDVLVGGSGNDTVHGGNGRDRAFLGDGDDIFFDNGQTGPFGADSISGEGGNDTLRAGGGNDTLSGGAGVDRFVFVGGQIGQDVVTDYAAGEDLYFDQSLWGGGLSSAQVVAQFADDSGADVVFDFGGGNTVTLTGLASKAGLDAEVFFL